MWDGRGFRVCGGDLGKNKNLGKNKGDMITDRKSDLGFTAVDSIHEIKINTKANNFQIIHNHHLFYSLC